MTGTEKKVKTEQKAQAEVSAVSPVVLRFNNVAFSYRTGPVLENASFHIHRGEFIALVGQNGAGKTTVLKLILGLEKPTGGSIEIFGKNPSAARQKIGYVPQHADYDQTFPISVMEVVRMGRLQVTSRRYNQDDIIAVKNAMEQTEIEDLAHRPYSALSGGQRRRVLVARALAANPELLILDEPSANMDIESEGRLFNTLGGLKGKTTILVVTHDSVFVSALTDRVLCVGGRSRLNGKGHSIAQHRAAPAENAPPDLYGGEVYKVLHDENLPGDSCCIENREAK
ncbi:MAG: metal ABC transporter ATP-binding protein [Spirochaetales bacterium]|nr:metal ABC transporter ATP-binding protein [Spirochaetales bacterium]